MSEAEADELDQNATSQFCPIQGFFFDASLSESAPHVVEHSTSIHGTSPSKPQAAQLPRNDSPLRAASHITNPYSPQQLSPAVAAAAPPAFTYAPHQQTLVGYSGAQRVLFTSTVPPSPPPPPPLPPSHFSHSIASSAGVSTENLLVAAHLVLEQYGGGQQQQQYSSQHYSVQRSMPPLMQHPDHDLLTTHLAHGISSEQAEPQSSASERHSPPDAPSHSVPPETIRGSAGQQPASHSVPAAATQAIAQPAPLPPAASRVVPKPSSSGAAAALGGWQSPGDGNESKSTRATLEDDDLDLGGKRIGRSPLERSRAEIKRLDVQVSELQRQVHELQAGRDAAQRNAYAAKAAVAAGQQHLLSENAALKAKITECEARLKAADMQARVAETQTDLAKQRAEHLARELRQVQDASGAAQGGAAALQDEAAQWRSRAMDTQREMSDKLAAAAEQERLLATELGMLRGDVHNRAAEVAALRRDVEDKEAALGRSRAEAAELQHRLLAMEAEVQRHAAAAGRFAADFEAERSSSHTLRSQIADLERRNAQLAYEARSAQEEAGLLQRDVERLREQAAAASSAMAATYKAVPSTYGVAPPPVVQSDAAPYTSSAPAYLVSSTAAPVSLYGPPSGQQYRRPASAATAVPVPPYVSSVEQQYSRPASAGPELQQQQQHGAQQRTRVSDGVATSTAWSAAGHLAPPYAASPSRPISQLQPASVPPATQPYIPYMPPSATATSGKVQYASPSTSTQQYSSSAMPPALQPYIPYSAPPLSQPYMSTAPAPIQATSSHQYISAVPAPVQAAAVGVVAAPSRNGAANLAQRSPRSAIKPTWPLPSNGTRASYSTLPPQAVAAPPAAEPAPTLVDLRASKVTLLGPNGVSPFGTELTLQDMLAHSKDLEDRLMSLCRERDQLQAEYARMPAHSGRSLKERERKRHVEQRIEQLNREASAVRMELKKINGK